MKNAQVASTRPIAAAARENALGTCWRILACIAPAFIATIASMRRGMRAPIGTFRSILLGASMLLFGGVAIPAQAANFAANYNGLQGSSTYTNATAVDGSGNSYIVGHFSGDLAWLDSVTLNRIGATDVFAAKIDANGTVLWAKNFGGAGATAQGLGIAVDGSGNVYLGGYLQNANLTTPALTRIGSQDAFAIKLDSSGNTTWAKNFGGASASARGSGIAVDGSGNVYLGGYLQSASLTTPALTRIGSQDAFAIKLDSSGNTTWAKNFGGAGATVYGTGIAVDGSGKVSLGGYFQSNNLTTPALTKIGGQDAFAIQLDSSGNTNWAKNFSGAAAQAQGNAVAVDGAGNIYLAGNLQIGNLTTPALTRIGTKDAFAIKLDSSGNTAWAKNFGGAGASALGSGIAVDGSGNVYLGGYLQSASLTTPALTKIGTQDAFAIKLDSSGTTTWAKNFGGVGATDFGTGIAVDGSSNVFLAGYFFSANLTTPALTRVGSLDAYAFKLDSSGNTTWTRNYGGGASASAGMRIVATAVDASGNSYIAGFTSNDYLTIGSVTATRIGTQDAFVAKLDATGTALWAKRIGGSGATITPTGVAVDSTGNIYLGGSFSGANVTTPALTRIGVNDTFAIKFDSSGNTTWANNFGGAGADMWAYGIAADGSGNVYLGGFFRTANLTSPALTRFGSEDAFAIKLDASGNTTWAKNFGGAGGAARGQAIAVDGSGNVYLGGHFYNANLTTPALTVIGNFDPMAIKLDSSGNTIWAQNFGGAGVTGQGSGIAVDGSGNVYLSGQWYGGNLTTPALTKIGFKDAFAFKLNSSGTTTWARNFAGSDVEAVGIAVDASSNVFLAGYFQGANLTTPALTKIGSKDAFAIKLDSSGTRTWAKNFGGASADFQAYAIAVDSNATVYLGGFFQSGNLTTPALTKLGSQDGVIIKQSTILGAPVIGTATLGGSTQATVTFSAPLDNGGFPVTGYTVTSSPAGGVDSNAGSTGLSHVITGLVIGTSYTFTVTATNANGTSVASAASNSVMPLTVPTATTSAAGSVASTSAILNGAVNDNGASTAVSFDYGPAIGYGTNVAATTGATVNAGAGSTAVAVTLTGLACNTTYHFRVNGVNSAGTTNGGDLTFTTSACVTNGACGSTHGTTVAFAPTANLCSAGSASGVTSGSGVYGWTCMGSNGGTTASCSASGQGAGNGAGTAAVSTNGWGFAPQGNGPLQSAGFIATSGHPKSPPDLPVGVSFPFGLFDFVLNTGTVGSSAVITITYPSTLPAGAVYWKYGPTPAGFNCAGPACAAPHWYQFPAVLAGNTATLTIVDGGVGDDDLVANGTIVDQGGPGFSLAGIPTLSEWARMLLAGMLAMFGMAAVRRKIR